MTSQEALRRALTDPIDFSHLTLPKHAARPYQIAPMRAIWNSVVAQDGKEFCVVFARQSGKDESMSQLIVSLLSRLRLEEASMVIGAPTDDQAGITLRRIHARALDSPVTAKAVSKSDHTITIGKANVTTLSAAPTANVRGHTASRLLLANEAQDIDPDIWDAVFEPMAASTNATKVFMGTVWDSSGLLARQMEYLRSIETPDDQRVFLVPWQMVAPHVPAYEAHVRGRIAQLGENHPFIKTEYELVPLDGEATLFPPSLLGQLQGSHERLARRMSHGQYALLVDVGGEELDGSRTKTFDPMVKRDSTTATIVELVRPDRISNPAFRVVDRRLWTGERHTLTHQVITDLALTTWRVSHVVIDQTGVGAGLTSMLIDSLSPHRIIVHPHHWTSATKSQTGWDLIAMIQTGRLKEYAHDGDPHTVEFWRQMSNVEVEHLPGPGHRIRWGVPVRLGHDDFVMSLALVAILDTLDLRPRTARGTVAR